VLRPEVVRRRLEKVGEYCAILERLRRYSLDQFLADPERYGSAERFLQLAIEALMDAASHVIAELELGVVNAGRDIPRLFRSHGDIDQDLEQRWIRMIGFRNILVHDYLEVDRAIVHDVLQRNLEDLRLLQKKLAEFL